MDIPFEVGGTYSNRRGPYTVVELTPPTMLIRYRDGHELRTLIADQARIWENIQIEADDPLAVDDDITDAPRRRRTIPAFRSAPGRPKPASEFDGLVENDFSDTPTGTYWRRRSSLGGLLASHLSARSGRAFESHAVSRRCEVYVYEPHRFNTETPVREAKFRFAVNPSGVLHGFYIEKSDKAMDGTWDWTRFTAALTRDPTLCTRMAVLLNEYALCWQLDVDSPSQPPLTTVQVTAAPDGRAQWRSDRDSTADSPETISWSEFSTRLHTLPADGWCNLMVCQSLPRERAIQLRAGIADHVTKIWHALLPLYLASVQTAPA